ncbi:MAG: PD-(D/E)XK nuclease family protein, partial [Acidobacteriota bacterium]|nr:PD-(D/E)XK nuclease family protein [Acidobacteriota bacterium]
DAAVSEFARPFLDARASKTGARPIPLVSPVKSGSLGRLAERNFGLSRAPMRDDSLEADGSLALVSAPGESRAATEIVREILRAAREGVISGFHEAAVILRRPESDIPRLSEALRLRKIPYYIHGGEKFSGRPLCQAALALSGLETADFSREAILTAVEFIGAALRENGTEKWDVENWRALTREAESLTGVRAWDAATRGILRRAAGTVRRLEQTNETEPEKLTASRKRLADARRLRKDWRKLMAAAAGWPNLESFAEWADFLRRRFGKILKTSPGWPRLGSALDKIAVLEALAQPVAGNKKYAICSAIKIRSLLDEAVQSLTYPVGRFQRGGVNLLGVSAARGLRFPLVVIPGLDEGRFPSKLRQDPLLPDAERRRLGSLPLRGARAEEEKLLFDMAARSAARRLVLITSRLDESADREKFPSLFFLRAATAASGGRVAPDGFSMENIPGFRSVSLDAAAPAEGLAAADEGEIRLRWIASGRLSTARALDELALAEPRRLRLPLEYEKARRKNPLTKFDGLISDPRLIQWTRQKLKAGAGQTSASRIEEYARCPYYFFLKQVLELRIEEDEREPTDGMDPLERGTAVHAALESFLKNHMGGGFTSAPEERLMLALEDETLRELEKIRPAGMPALLWEIERDGMLALMKNWLLFEIARADGDMRIARLEQAFGNISEFPPFRPKAGGEPDFEFCGRIDRADISADGKRARVIDYKTGKLPDTLRSKDRALLMGGEKIQLAVYRGALAALEEFAAAESVEAEYLYLQPKDGRIRQSVLTPEQMEAAFADLPRVLRVLDSCMKNGLFFARTHSLVHPYGHCDYCDFQPVCGKDREWREKQKSGDPAISEFLTVQKNDAVLQS